MQKSKSSHFEYAKIILNKVSFCSTLMEKEYYKALAKLNAREKNRLKAWVKYNFNRDFSQHHNNGTLNNKSSNLKWNNMLFGKPLRYLIISTSLLTFGCNQNNGEQQGKQQNENRSPAQTEEKNQSEGTSSEVTDEELENFSAAMKIVQEKQQKSQENMMQYMEDQGMELEKYREMMNAQQNQSQNVDENQFSEQELEKFNKINEAIEEMNQEMQNEMNEVLGDHQLDEKRFQEISMMIQQDPELQRKFQQMSEQ